MTTPNYSKSEWASLSIQERIRAMNKVAGDDESIQNSIPEEEHEEQKKELPKRSSVVDIWRKREGPGGTNKEKKSPVSVPWPDEEEEEESAAENASANSANACSTEKDATKATTAASKISSFLEKSVKDKSSQAS